MSVEDLQKEMIGKMADPVVMSVEKGAIARFAEAVGDPNPLYCDEEYARKSPHGSIIAMPGFFGWPRKSDALSSKLAQALIAGAAREGFPVILDAGIDYEFSAPIRAGDTLVSSSQVADMTVREGKGGKMLLVSIKTTYQNQSGAIVAISTTSVIFR